VTADEEPREFSAGPLHVLLAGGDLRYLTAGREELVRRIYVAVRDANWNTVEPRITNVRATQEPDESGFRIEYDAEHVGPGVDFAWHATITGRWELHGATGRAEVDFELDGVARSTFQTRRTGFCILHPTPASEEVCPVCVVRHTGGRRTRQKLPYPVSPQAVFTDVRSLAHWPWPGDRTTVTIELGGEVFETEDQRNYGDASFKTYARPQSLPAPYTLKEGEAVRQTVNVEVVLRNHRPRGHHRRVLPRYDRAAAVYVLSPGVSRARGMGLLPAVGVSRGAAGRELSDDERDLLRALNLQHMRIDLDESESPTDMGPAALRAIADATALGLPLEVALHQRPPAQSTLAKRVAPLLREADVARFIVYQPGQALAPPEAVAAARRDLSTLFPDVPVGAGAAGGFVDLNRNRPPAGSADVLAWASNPQMHSTDDLTLTENFSALGDAVRTARTFADGAGVAVGPVTLHRPKFPPVADPRQGSDLGAAWTLGALKSLAEAGADAVTLYEAAGPFGLMDEGGPLPPYHVLADVLEFAGGELLATDVTEPRWLCALALRKEDRLRVLVANLHWRPRPVRLAAIPEYDAEIGSRNPLQHVLPPYGVARFDFVTEE
jgi:hypothetical protein